MRRALIAAAAAGLLLAGCSSEPAAESEAPAPATSAAVEPSGPAQAEPEPEPEVSEGPAVEIDAGALAEALVTAVDSATEFEAYTEDTDPNELIGRPGQYVSVAVVDDEGAIGEGGTDRGATVEVFATAEDAQRRSEYILGILKDAGPALGTEWHHVTGPALLRVSGGLKPSVNDAYAEAWAEITR